MQAAHLRVMTAAVLVVVLLMMLVTPASATSECVADAPDDVRDRATEGTGTMPQADILGACVIHDADVLEISVRTAEPTDPATDPVWDDFGSAVGAAIDTDGDGEEDFDANYARFRDGSVIVRVFVHETSEQLCSADGRYDGTRYRLLIPTACIGNPAQVSAAAFTIFGSSPESQEEVGFSDDVPAFPAFIGPYDNAVDPATEVTRLSGATRIDTAIAVSGDDFGPGSAGAVVLARADSFPDALAAAPLAVATDGPLLLTESTQLSPAVAAEIQRVLPEGGTVHLSGGTAALSDAVRDQVGALGYTVVRAAGANRYATSVQIARAAVADPAVIVVADGNGFADALVGGSLAGFENGVEILSNGAEMNAEGAAYLAEHPDAEVLAVGAVAAQAAPDATPLVGPDPFTTSIAVAERYGEVEAVAFASGTNFPDGLAGGAHAGRRAVPLLLSWPDVLPDSIATYLETTAPLEEITMYGGVVALSYEVEADVEAALR